MGIFGNIFGGNSNNENLAKLVNDGAFLVDVRFPDEFADGSVIPLVSIF